MLPPPSKTRAFSFAELLLSLAVLGILIAFLHGAVSNAIQTARAASCLTKLRGLGVAAHAFMGENAKALPYSSATPNWMVRLGPYLGAGTGPYAGNTPATPALRCPADQTPQRRTYRYHQSFPSEAGAKQYGKSNYVPTHFTQIAKPATHAMFFCITFLDSRSLPLWGFDNAIWKETSEPLYPPGNQTFGRPHYRERGINLLYSDGHAAAAFYPLPPETWHFDGQ